MRSAVVGLGPMGKRHIAVLESLGLKIVGLCDRREEAIKKLIEEKNYKENLFYQDAEKMIKEINPELVVIATNSDSHYDLTKISVENNARYIFCEKPMANSLKDAEEMVKMCNEKGVKLAINHQSTFMECYKRIKEKLLSKELGGLQTFSITAGNIGLAMNGSHYLNLAMFFFDENFEKVSAIIEKDEEKNVRGENFQDAGGVLIGITKNKKKFVLSIGVREGHGINMIFSCKYGYINYNPLKGRMVIDHRKEENRDQPMARYGLPSITEEVVVPQDDIILATKKALEALLNEGKEVSILVERAVEVIKVLTASYYSSEKGGILVDLVKDKIVSRKFPWP